MFERKLGGLSVLVTHGVLTAKKHHIIPVKSQLSEAATLKYRWNYEQKPYYTLIGVPEFESQLLL